MKMSNITHDMKLFIIKNLEGTQTLIENRGEGSEFVLVNDEQIAQDENLGPVVVSSSRDELSDVFSFIPTERHGLEIVEVEASIKMYAKPSDHL